MKIAVCFWGQIRTGVFSSPSILSYFGDLVPNIDFFVHSWNIESVSYPEIDQNPMLPNLEGLPRKIFKEIEFFNFDVSDDKKSNFLDTYKPKKFIFDDQKRDNFMIPPHYISRHSVNLLKQQYEQENNFKYDVVISMRPDLMFSSSDSLSTDLIDCNLNNDKIYNRHYNVDTTREKLIESLFIMGNSHNIDIFSSFIMQDIEPGPDTQELDYQYSVNHGLTPNRIVNYDFIVYRYYSVYMTRIGISDDALVQQFYKSALAYKIETYTK